MNSFEQAIALACLCVVAFLAGCTRPGNELTGEWRGTGVDGSPFVMTLRPDSSYSMISGQQAVDESMYKDMDMQWKVDDQYDPKRLTLISKEGANELIIPVIYNFLDKDRLVIRFGLTPNGVPVDWGKLNWSLEGPGSAQIVLERYAAGD